MTDIVRLAPKQVAEICDCWLRDGEKDSVITTMAADLAVTVAENRLGVKILEGRHHEDQIDKLIFRAVLASWGSFPERCADVALIACGRKEPCGRVLQRMKDAAVFSQEIPKPRQKSSLDRHTVFTESVNRTEMLTEAERPAPWPDGPSTPVDRAFREICLAPDSLLPVMIHDPKRTAEVILSSLIERPRLRYFDGEYDRHSFFITQETSFFPPFYNKGPFLLFLLTNCEGALDLIIRLVHFATERWAERFLRKNTKSPCVAMSLERGQVSLTGDERVYYWYRGSGSCPNAVVSALMALEKWFYDRLDSNKPVEKAISNILEKSRSVAFAGLLSALGKKQPDLFRTQLQPILGVPEFYLWESHNVSDTLAYETVGWGNPQLLGWHNSRKSEWEVRLAEAWHRLPHRRVELWEIARFLLLNYPAIGAYIENARRVWQSRIAEASDGSHMLKHLERLIAGLDVANWKSVNDPKHGYIWVYEAPPQLVSKAERQRQAISGELALFQFPVRCRRILDGKEPLRREDVPQFWDNLRNIPSIERPSHIESGMGSHENALCAGATVLILLHRDWLKEDIDREKWCVRQLIETILQPPAAWQWDSPMDEGDFRWDSYCAVALPRLWAEEPASPEFRRCIGSLGANYHYNTVGTLMYWSAQHRAILGQNFGQLQHLVMRLAALRRTVESQGWEANPVRRDHSWARDEIEKFVSDEIPAHVPSWDKLAQGFPDEPCTDEFCEMEEVSGRPFLDFYLIQAAYSWLPSLGEARNVGERAEWVEFWKQALSYTVEPVLHRLDEPERVGTPDEWDRWILFRLPAIICSMTSDENPEVFWKPILELGLDAHYWVEEFLNSWFWNGLQSEPLQASFLQQWQLMIDYAFLSEKWKFDSRALPYYLENMWSCLMGLDANVLRFWTEEQTVTIDAMRNRFLKWCDIRLRRPRCAKSFIYFLAKPAAIPLLPQALIRLDEQVKAFSERFFWEREILNALSSLLSACFQHRLDGLRRSERAFRAFANLVKVAANFGDRVAIEIQQRLASKSGS